MSNSQVNAAHVCNGLRLYGTLIKSHLYGTLIKSHSAPPHIGKAITSIFLLTLIKKYFMVAITLRSVYDRELQ
jgi:hypothetical protein